MPARKIDFYFNSSDSLRSLAREARRLAELQQVFLNIAPPALTPACRVKLLRAGTLFLLAENAAVAAKLKQLAPRLLKAYRQQGFEVTSIRMEVQVMRPRPDAAPKSGRKRLSAESIEKLELLAAGLDDSPLKQALARLAARQRVKN